MTHCIIFNPGSKGGKSGRRRDAIEGLLKARGISYEWKTTICLQDAYNYSVQANRKEYEGIVAIGGDGTINKVMSGFYDKHGRRLSKASMGIIYTGTSPDFCKSYDIPLKLDEAVDVLAEAKSKSISVGRIRFASHEGGRMEPEDMKTMYFGCCANIGLGPAVAAHANSGIRRYIGDVAGTFAALIRSLASYRPQELELTIDGQAVKFADVINISIGKTRYIASGIKVSSDIKPGDDRFYVMAVHNWKAYKLPEVLRGIYSGRPITDSDQLALLYGREIRVQGPSGTRIEFDGDPAGWLPCAIETAKDRLDVICR